VAGRFDLAVAASENDALDQLTGPVLLVPHGAGFEKYYPGTRVVAGLDPARLVRARAADAGVTVLGPDQGWQPALVAADCVLSDHGSTSLYAAALDKPLLLAGGPGTTTVAGSATAALREVATALDVDGDLRAQIDAVRGAPPSCRNNSTATVSCCRAAGSRFRASIAFAGGNLISRCRRRARPPRPRRPASGTPSWTRRSSARLLPRLA
jgi:hypothetical protein